MTKRAANAAIQARRDGVWDHPDLCRWGPVSTEADCAEIAKSARG